MKGFPDLPPIWAAAIAALAWLLSQMLPIWRFGDPGRPADALILIGLGIILWSAVYFFTKKTPIEPHHTPKTLIVEGPYRLSRNPIYLGLTLILVGYALGLGAITALLPVIAFPMIIARRFVQQEEAALRQAFGTEADEYIDRTARWIGFGRT